MNDAVPEFQARAISVVVAVYENEGSLAETHKQISALFDGPLKGHTLEIVFVNDGSSDGSLEELHRIRETDPSVKVITFTRNFGQMAAMLAGFAEATGDAVINISADLQDPINLIVEMAAQWQSGAEIVVCYRTNRSDPMAAKAFSWLAYGVLRMAVPQIPSGGFDYVLMDRVAMDQFNAMDTRHRFFQGDLLWPGYRTNFIPYERKERTIGKSQYNFTKKLKNFTDAVLDSSFLPIRAISVMGFFTSFLGLLYAISILFAWAGGATPFDGWAPLMMVILIIGGMIMVMLGVIGEYVWRINEEVRKRPNYVIRDKFL
ncbi:glycosyltransferase family 2 protein [Roseovarius sp. LXJ103]|uniref:glycosyltransferase family 2 protein n=1 Tax=Roseovarius carneus TaxID=2853164 RepID=UPI000D603C50|nr:glycosyltransferase family 2 protein [Roseovarius carneus]MBZ8119938.1 glycosyltransferase family 2 protein [Roseovarius carneus]PWE34471.1 glycosyl transferase family 2 [Pelagicola sp. LXJ1103]